MIQRYAISEITQLWSLQNKLDCWWKIEKLVCWSWYQLGVINQKDWQAINQQKVVINIDRFLMLETKTHHELVAFLTMILEQTKTPAKRWIHYGLTASDVIDTSQNLCLVQSICLTQNRIKRLSQALLMRAQKEKKTPIMGRTHGVFAEPTSLGLKFLNWYVEIKRWLKLLAIHCKNVSVVNLSGSVGNYAHLNPQIQLLVADKLGLSADWSTSQITQRDRYIGLFSTLAGLANSFAKIATEFRHWQKSEVNEVCETFDPQHQIGSSSMPHKQNPISAENICGLSRVLISNLQVFYDNNLLWNERDISHSSSERIVIPQCFHLIIYLTDRLLNLVQNMQVLTNNIQANFLKTYNRFYSQLVMNDLIKNYHWPREQAYQIIKRCSLRSLKTETDFLIIVKSALKKNHLNPVPIIKRCQIDFYLRHVDLIFQRVLKKY